MSIFNHPQFLRRVLWADAISGAASALLHLVAGPALAPMLGLPPALFELSGFVLLGAVALATYLGTCEVIPRAGVGLLIAGNFLWVAACAIVFAMNTSSMTKVGEIYLIIQALAVAALAELEWFGLRRAPQMRAAI